MRVLDEGLGLHFASSFLAVGFLIETTYSLTTTQTESTDDVDV